MNFHPPFSEPLLSFYSYPSNIKIIFDFSDIITKIHPHFKILDPPLQALFVVEQQVCLLSTLEIKVIHGIQFSINDFNFRV